MNWTKFVLTILFISPFFVLGQETYSDSLKTALADSLDSRSKLVLLNELSNSIYSSDPNAAINYGNEAKNLAFALQDSSQLAYALKNIGLGYYVFGNYLETSLFWEQSLEIYRLINDDLGAANLLSNLGVVYGNQGDDAKAIDNYLQSLRISEELGDSLRIASALGNVGFAYSSKPATFDLALLYLWRSLKMGEQIRNPDVAGISAYSIGDIYYQKGQKDSLFFDSSIYYLEKSIIGIENTTDGAATLNLIGRIYAEKDDYDQALSAQREALLIAGELNAKREIADANLGLAQTYQMMGDNIQAIAYFKEAQSIAESIDDDYKLKRIYQGLAQSFYAISEYQQAYIYKDLYDVVKDSIYNAETDDQIKELQFSYEIDKREGQIEILEKNAEIEGLMIERQQTTIYAGVAFVFILFVLSGGLFNRYRYIRRTKRIIELEKDKSQQLLLNILPEETARELEDKGQATPRYYENVSVLFTDFKGFTTLAESLTSEELVDELNDYFSAFDDIIDQCGLEKIKTIGDAYMCAGGIPVESERHAADTVAAGLALQEFMTMKNLKREEAGLPKWELRVGIHSGPITAGVVGKRKYAYDIWGDTVNLASRMESNGESGKVNISESTYQQIKDLYNCKYRGKIEAKNKGEVDMYFVEEKVQKSLEASISSED